MQLEQKKIEKFIIKVGRDRHIGGTVATDQFVNSMKQFARTSLIIDNYFRKILGTEIPFLLYIHVNAPSKLGGVH